jgi:hypothetical protein
MKKILTSPLFLIYCFILFFVIINVYIIFKFDVSELFDSYVMIYLFWFLIIVILTIISRYTSFKEDKNV